ncbi:MAG: zinc-dependent metalloprotease [Xanthomonadales bacterium]|nr:zinc-dependent metalloprotease [Xanthomonadales bacterium]
MHSAPASGKNRSGFWLTAAGILLLAAGTTAWSSERLTPQQFVDRAGTATGDIHLGGLQRAGGGETWLTLSPAPIFTHDAKVIVVSGSDSQEWPLPQIHHFHGHERDDPEALAFVSVHPDGRIRGWLRRAGQMEAFGQEPGERATTLSLSRVDLASDEARREFSCGSDALAHPDPELHPAGKTASQPASGASLPVSASGRSTPKGRGSERWFALAVDSDYEYFQRFGNVNGAAGYAADLIGYSSLLYQHETNTGLLIPWMRLFSSPANDPWQQSQKTSCMLFELGLHWHQHLSHVPRSFVHMLSGKNAGGGIAWLGTACRTSNTQYNIADENCPGLPANAPYVGGYGLSAGITGGFNPVNPQSVWDIVVVAHEIGHNLNSPHTHCYGGLGGHPSPIDGCAVEPSGANYTCHAGATSLPGPAGLGSGTIMSYCHLLGGGLSNISLNFGSNHSFGIFPARVPARIGDFVQQLSMQSPACFANPAPEDNLFGDGFECGPGRPGCTGGAAICLSSVGATANAPYFSGDPGNTVRNLNIGAGNTLTGLALDLRVQAFAPSWLSEATLVFSSSNLAGNHTYWSPFEGQQQSGIANFTSNGVLNLVANNLQITAGQDGILRVEWSETFNDPEVNPDSLWSNHPSPTVCPGIRLVCSNQAACDAAVLATP